MDEIRIGVQVGQGKRPSAICVATSSTRDDDEAAEIHFDIRRLERCDLGTKYPDLANRLAEIESGTRKKARDTPMAIFVNATGTGVPVIELINSKLATTAEPVYFNYGDRREEETEKTTLGKALLVSRLQVLLQSGRLHLPDTKEARILAEELADYEVDVPADANERYGAFKVGTQDDLVTALGLAVQVDRVLTCGALAHPPGW